MRTGLLPLLSECRGSPRSAICASMLDTVHHLRLMEEDRRPATGMYSLLLSAAGLHRQRHVRHGRAGWVMGMSAVSLRATMSRSGFQQNHAIVRISGKTVGQYAAGRAAANDQMGRNRSRLS